jgi:hypothetical protein
MSPALSTAAISYVLTIKTRRAAINDRKLQLIDQNAHSDLASRMTALNLSSI